MTDEPLENEPSLIELDDHLALSKEDHPVDKQSNCLKYLGIHTV